MADVGWDHSVTSPYQLLSGNLIKDGCALVMRRTVVSDWVHFRQAQEEVILLLAVKGDPLVRSAILVALGSYSKTYSGD